MICDKCREENSRVVDTRHHEGAIRRVRVCNLCHYTWTTEERKVEPSKH